MITKSSQPFVHITGSAEFQADPERLGAAHAFVKALVDHALDAGAGFTLFLGPEPKSTEGQP